MHLLTAFLTAAATQIAPAPALEAAPADLFAPGTYALVMRFVTEADAPIVGKVTTATVTTALVDVQNTDGKIIARQRACSMATDGGLFSVKAGPAFLRAMAPATYEIQIDGDRVHADLGIASVGVDPKVRTLPKSRNDPAFTDPDKDGALGAPLEVDVGGMKLRLDVASVGHATLEGSLRDGHIAGKPRVLFSEERILGGLPEFASGGTKRVVEADSSFAFEPLPAGATCGAVEHVASSARFGPGGTRLASSSAIASGR